jgi:hypothetical protein
MEGFATLDSAEFFRFFSGCEKVIIHAWEMVGPVYQGLGLNELVFYAQEGDESRVDQGVEVSRDQLKVSVEEVSRFEAVHGDWLLPPAGGQRVENEKFLVGKPNIARYVGEKYTGGSCSVPTIRDWIA